MKKAKKRYLSLAVAAALFVSTAGVSQTALAACGDIGGHWAEDTIVKWEEEGYISGYSDGTFRPNQPISRAAFVALANRAFGFSWSAEISFQDVPPSYWGYEEIQKGVAAGYVYGNSAGLFRPDDAVTRQEAAVMLARINHLPIGSGLSLTERYADSASIADWAKPYVEAVTNAGIMSGFRDGSFGPSAFMTRAQGVVVLDKAASASENHETADYILTENTLRDMVVEGDLILSSALGGQSIVLDNVTVNGTVKVQGGGTVHVQSCDFGAVELDKSGVVFSSDSDTSITRLEFLQKGTIKGQGYASVVIAENRVTEAVIDAAVEAVQLRTDANVKLSKGAAVSTLDITEDAAGGKITLSRGASVDDMNVRGKVRITGQGDVSSMTVYVPGIISSVKPDSVELKEEGKTPSYTGGDSSGGGDSSSGDSSSAVRNAQVTAITLAPSKASYQVKETITATAALSGPLGDTVSWSSSDSGYAVVTPDPGDSTRAVIQIIKADTTDRTVTISAKTGEQASAVEQTIVIEKVIPVTRIDGVPESMALNRTLTLAGTVVPNDATGQTITWEMIDAGGTGATLSGDTLTSAGQWGTVTVRATVAGGALTGDYTQDFQIHVGPRIKEMIVDTTPAPAGTKKNVQVVIEHAEPGYKVNWTASSSEITPTYGDIYSRAEQYTVTATATLAFLYRGEAANITANLQDSDGKTVDSERVSISGVATITEIRINNWGEDSINAYAKYGQNTLEIRTTWPGTFHWRIEVAPATEDVLLSGTTTTADEEQIILTVGENVPEGTQITVIVSVEGNPDGERSMTYTVGSGG